MNHYTEVVPFDLAKKLKDSGFPQDSHYNWYDAEGRVYINLTYEDRIAAPTYAEVLDWLFKEGIYIELLPGITFSTIDHFGFDFVIHHINLDTYTMEKTKWEDFASFPLAMNTAIEKSLEICKSLFPGQNQS